MSGQKGKGEGRRVAVLRRGKNCNRLGIARELAEAANRSRLEKKGNRMKDKRRRSNNSQRRGKEGKRTLST